MPAPLYDQTQYGIQLQKHLPRGAAWPREADAVQSQVCKALGASFSRVNADANALLVDGFPGTAVDLLPEWEATLGLVATGTTGQRQAAVLLALEAAGGASISYFVGLALSLGFSITITTYRPGRCRDLLTRRLYGVDAAFRWTVTTTAAGSHVALEALFLSYAPAHTTVDFVYF